MRARVAVACSGLGVVQRGYESFSQELFEQLYRLDSATCLLQGGGREDRARNVFVLPTMRRDGRVARFVGALLGRTGYDSEQISFGVGAYSKVRQLGVDVVAFSDAGIGGVLLRLRRACGGKFRLLFTNGAPHEGRFLPACDFVQQVTPEIFERSRRDGVSESRMSLLPLGFDVSVILEGLRHAMSDRSSVRREFGLVDTRKIVLCVAAINRYHKRIDHLIEEIGRIESAERPFVLVLGNREEETDGLEALATRVLGSDGYAFRTVPAVDVRRYLGGADEFVLPSVVEGFGRAVVEAGVAGLRCWVHDYGVMRYVLGSHGQFVDMRQPGGLANPLASALRSSSWNDEMRRVQQADLISRFGWQGVIGAYVEMFERCAALPPLRETRSIRGMS